MIEERGPLDDAQALRAAALLPGGHARRLAERARRLGERLGLDARLRQARAVAPAVLLGLALAVVLAGLALAAPVLGDTGRRINVMAALAALLGVHALTLAVWLLALLLPAGLSASGGAVLGRLWLGLTARLSLGRGAESAALLRALTRLLERARLLPWVLGGVSHAVWSLCFAAALVVLVGSLALRSYTLSWETTILSPGSFVSAVRALGAAPSLLGFPVPDAATVLAPVADAAGQRQWALWLIGCVTVYGLLPRLACLLLCAAVWRLRRHRLQPDLDDPAHRRLIARLDALAPAVVVDPDTLQRDWRLARSSYSLEVGSALALIGFELPPELPWPPAGLPGPAPLLLATDGSAAGRIEVLATLAQARPRTAVLACHAPSSPDRGTERFLRELLPTCGECRLWLTGTAPATAAQQARWSDWLAACGLAEVRCVGDLAQALRPAP